MGQFLMEKSLRSGSVLSGNQQAAPLFSSQSILVRLSYSTDVSSPMLASITLASGNLAVISSVPPSAST